MSVLPRSIINRIDAEHFCEEDITTAKDTLYSNVSVPPKQRCIKQQGADKTKIDIDDIYKVLDETDPDALPIFIARDHGKLPSIDFNHVDMSTLSRDITACKNNQQDTDARLQSLVDSVSAICKEVSTLVSSLSPAVHPPTNAPQARKTSTCKSSSTLPPSLTQSQLTGGGGRLVLWHRVLLV